MTEFINKIFDTGYERDPAQMRGCFFGGGGGGGTTQTVQKADPWSGIQPQLTQAAGDTQNLYNQGLLKQQYYPNSTVAQFAPQQQQAIDMTTQRATNGSPVNTANQQQVTDTLNGKYLDPSSNPYLQDTYNQAAKGVEGTVNSAFGQGGRYGSGLNQYALGQNLNNLATDIYGGAYQSGRTNQLQASALAPQAANTDYTDIGALANAGAQVQGQSQANLSDLVNRFNFNQQQPSQNVANYVGLLNGAGGNYGSSTTSSPYYQNNTANALGMGLGGLGALSSIGSLTSGSGLLSASSMPGLASMFSFLSDMRIKENIREIGHENGFPLYEFSYKHDAAHTRYIGVMAQDVIKTRPEAVVMDKGYYKVNYTMLGIEFREAA